MNNDLGTALIQEEHTSVYPTMAAPATNQPQAGVGSTGGGVTQTTGADLSHLNFLADVGDEMYIKQPVRGKELFMEQCLGCEMSNYYEAEKITQTANTKTIQKLFVLHEDSACIMRQCCGPRRPLTLNAVFPEADPESDPLFQIIQPYRQGCCCCSPQTCIGRAMMEVVVKGVSVGFIEEDCVCDCNVEYSVKDCNGQLLCRLKRFFCHCECSKKVPFHIFDANNEETGKAISKEFAGWLTEMFSDADTFLIQFPDFMQTVERRLLLIGMAMMIEFRHFEEPAGNENSDGM